MPFDGSHLAIATNGLRLLAMVLASAILLYWLPSVWRILIARGKLPGDLLRAPWVPLAGAVLTFQVRWFWPHFDQLTKNRLAFVAQAGMAMALMFAIYVHGSHAGVLRLRRALVVHVVLLALCIGASSVLR
jgi:hypothetical protein